MNEQIITDSSIKLDHISRIFGMVTKVPFFTEKKARINQIEHLPGGLTNSNYKVTIDGVTYAIRVAGDGTIEYLDRKAEKNNATLMSEMNINAEIIYYDETTGNQICKYIDDSKTLHIPDFKEAHNLKEAAKIFNRYHNSGKEFLALFDPIKVTDEYFDLLVKKNHKDFFEGFDKVKEKFEAIKAALDANPPKLAPCHNDPLPENYIVNDTGMYLIDWEYSGMNDPSFDLAALIIENELDEELEKIFLDEYFEGKMTFAQYSSVVINKFLCDALWSIWALLQIATGKPHEDYWPYGLNRFNRCVKLMEEENFDKYIEALHGEGYYQIS
ncbi:MAG: phosphotransferase [Bacillota bacterium]|nr:phosphotransferase [Bacillota bacterium]